MSCPVLPNGKASTATILPKRDLLARQNRRSPSYRWCAGLAECIYMHAWHGGLSHLRFFFPSIILHRWQASP